MEESEFEELKAEIIAEIRANPHRYPSIARSILKRADRFEAENAALTAANAELTRERKRLKEENVDIRRVMDEKIAEQRDTIDKFREASKSSYRQAIEDAAEAAENALYATRWGCDGDCGTFTSIPKAIRNLSTKGDTCEWSRPYRRQDGVVARDIGCGGWTDKDNAMTFKVCPYCGKPVTITADKES